MYLIYRIDNGEIVKQISGTTEVVELNTPAGHASIVGEGSWHTHKVIDGVVTLLPQPRAFPYAGAKWDSASAAFIDPRSLEQAREQAWEEVKRWRALALDANLVTPYGEFDCKEADRKNITDTVLLAQVLSSTGQPVAIDFTLADNSVVTLDAGMTTSVGLLLGQRVQTAHARARELRGQLDNFSKEQLQNLTWE